MSMKNNIFKAVLEQKMFCTKDWPKTGLPKLLLGIQFFLKLKPEV